MPLDVSSTCAHHQEVKITLHSLWYQHIYRWPSRARDVYCHSTSALNLNSSNPLGQYTISEILSVFQDSAFCFSADSQRVVSEGKNKDSQGYINAN